MSAENSVSITVSIITCVATVISLAIAIIAIFQSNKQIKLSNKQNLFNDRVRIYLIVRGLIKLYMENKSQIEEEKCDKIYFASEFVFENLINNSYLEIMGGVIKKKLHQPEQKEFLKKIEELNNEAEKSKIIFETDISGYLLDFIKSYGELLMQLYKYMVLIEDMRRIEDQMPIKKDIEEVAKNVNEKAQREELFKSFENLKTAFNNLEEHEIIKRMEAQIKL